MEDFFKEEIKIKDYVFGFVKIEDVRIGIGWIIFFDWILSFDGE